LIDYIAIAQIGHASNTSARVSASLRCFQENFEVRACNVLIPAVPSIEEYLTACPAGSAPPCCPIYTVQPGDTATSVAAAQSVIPNLLTFVNSLPTGATLTPGQSIQLPCARLLNPLAKGVAARQNASVSPAPSPAPSG